MNKGDEFQVGNFKYVIEDDNEVWIYGYKSTSNDTEEITIPEKVEYEGKCYEVTGFTCHALGTQDMCSWDCDGMFTQVHLPAKDLSGDQVFIGQPIKEVVIPEGVTRVEAEVFQSGEQLTKITLPSTIQSIGESAFGYNPIKTIICYATEPPILEEGRIWEGEVAFPFDTEGEEYNEEYDCYDSEVPSDVVVYVPKGCKGAYEDAYGWERFEDIREME